LIEIEIESFKAFISIFERKLMILIMKQTKKTLLIRVKPYLSRLTSV
jgi:hypothetical protein